MEEQPRSTEQRDITREIGRAFGLSASYYDEHALLRKEIANRLIASLEPWQAIIPAGPVIELGCGTGFVTEGLAGLYPDRQIEVTDLSGEMVSYCREKFSSADSLSFTVRDAEQAPPEEQYYALAVNSFSAQWFKDPALTLGRWLEAIKPGGLMLVAFPGNESFPEWQRHCKELGLPFTGNALPDIEEMVIKMSLGPSQVDYYEDTATQSFDSALQFFKHIKQIGAATQLEGKRLSPRELSMLIDHWDRSSGEGPVHVSYHVVFLAVKRDF